MATLTPIVALIDDDTACRLAPIVAELIEAWETRPGADVERAFSDLRMAANGWTYEMFAWGQLLRSLALSDPQVQR